VKAATADVPGDLVRVSRAVMASVRREHPYGQHIKGDTGHLVCVSEDSACVDFGRCLQWWVPLSALSLAPVQTTIPEAA